MTVVLAVAVVVLAVVVLVLLWRGRPSPYIEFREQVVVVPPPRTAVCDLCETEPATVHLVETFDDAEERELGGGSTAMRADYCQTCADELGVT